jgi:succinate dehydrogenase / fumarate reductase cytochrome b subunit
MATAVDTEQSTSPQAPRQAPWIVQLYGTALGKKYAMAISGIVGLGYIFGHMVGNLKMYFGPEAIDGYSEWLREGLLYPILPHTVMLWILRLVLIAALVVHVHAAYSLTVVNRRARGTDYQSTRHYVAADFAARTMRWTGVIVLLFIAFHLADLTWGVEAINPDWEEGAAYANLVASLSRAPVAAFYLLANLALGVHIYHGIWSLFQTMGWNNRRFNQYRRELAIGFTLVVIGGNLSFPIAVLTGIVG